MKENMNKKIKKEKAFALLNNKKFIFPKIIFLGIMLMDLGFLLQCSSELGNPRPTAINLDRRRGCAIIQEVNWAGSMRNDGTYDADDDFIEILNRDCNKPIDLAGWRIILRGDVNRIFYVPKGPNTIVGIGQYGVIIGKKDGAFKQGSHTDYRPIHLPGFFIPEKNWTIETKTGEDFLIENEIGARHNLPLAGSFDGVLTRSMERTLDNFEEEGGSISSWFSYTPCNEASPGGQSTLLMGTACTNFFTGHTGKYVDSSYNRRTFASVGEINTPDYR